MFYNLLCIPGILILDTSHCQVLIYLNLMVISNYLSAQMNRRLKWAFLTYLH